ncbi:hypothetical protein GOBAR_AA40041 [Gossypium barbadense]|uniref:Uncharacterized protein n=1 Tax=Gossypium barbadense TaxID=3634 RepID=A0A2P5VPA7_GOSBA|nr:hypothetical protein GOBAR_AA40041 [Gossypium barbadense]
MERKTIELDQGWDYMHKGIKKLRRILEGLPEPPFTSEEYMMLYTYGWYFTFVQVFVYLFLIYLQGFSPKKMVNPWKTYVKLSAVLMGSHGLTKGSLAFLNYPAQLMFKSTKVNPQS